jgi:hypothetical protein
VAVVEVDEAESAEVELEGAVLLVAGVEQHRGPDARRQLDRLAVAQRDDLGEPQPAEHLVEVTRPEGGAQHRQVTGRESPHRPRPLVSAAPSLPDRPARDQRPGQRVA